MSWSRSAGKKSLYGDRQQIKCRKNRTYKQDRRPKPGKHKGSAFQGSLRQIPFT